jgi:hypothetical protein
VRKKLSLPLPAADIFPRTANEVVRKVSIVEKDSKAVNMILSSCYVIDRYTQYLE